MFKHILIPTDGSETAAKAIQAGVQLAAEMGAKVTGYHALEPVPIHLHGEGYITDKKMIDEFERRARDFAERCVEQVAAAARAARVKFEPLVVRSPVPYKGIVDAAASQDCDAIVMASHGHRGVTKLILGSVTQALLTHSTIPVLVLR